jgi:glycosyltransferase involved in cell wall biosynthesis
MRELVSIITPNYNAGKYIGEAIESVFAQTYQNWELLIIDDFSTDNSIEVIGWYIKQDSRIRLFRTGANSGSPAKPRNIGILNANGRYIAFLDSDDVWLPDKLESQIKLFGGNTAIVFSNYEKITEDGIRNKRIITAPKTISYNKLLYSNYIGCLTAVYDSAKTGKRYFEDVRHEDYILWLDILRGGYAAVNTNTVCALYRTRQNSVASKKIETLKWQWNIYRRILGLSVFKSIYYYCFYAVNAFRKYIV